MTELLEGETLRGKLDGSTIKQRQAIDYILQIAKGLSAAHGKGVVHRDLKPENVFVSRDGHVKILDFGLAKRVESAGSEQTNAPTGSGHTEPGTVMGTMGYMSPEQLRGLPVDHRSDIFSLGAILYELLSGQKAFKKNTASDTIAAVLKEDPPELTQSGRNISPALDHIVKHCLEKDRENRFQSAKDVAFALSEASAPTTTTVTSGMHAVASEGSGRKKLAIAAGLVAVALGAGLVLWKRPTAVSPAASGGIKRVAVLPFENLGSPEEDYFADGIADEVRGKLTSLPGVQVIARGSSTPYKKTTKTPKQIAEELDVSYLLTATVRWDKSGGGSRVQVRPELIEVSGGGAPTSKWQQPFDAPLTDVFQVQSDIATRVAQSLGVALGAGEEKQLAERPTQSVPAYEAFLKGEEAAQSFSKTDPSSVRKALGFYEQAAALDPGFAEAWAAISIGNSYLYSNSSPSPEVAERARQAAEKSIVLAPNRPQGHEAMGNYMRLVLVDPRGAEEQFARGRAVAPRNARLLLLSGSNKMSLGLLNAGLEHLREAQRLDPRSASVYGRLGWLLLCMRRYPEAREELDRGLALSPDNLSMLERRAMTFLGQGELDGARASLATTAKGVEPTQLVAYVAYYQDLGWVLTPEQRELLLRLTPAAFDDDRGMWGLTLAQVLWWNGDAAGARKYAEEARKTLEAQLLEAPDDGQRHVLVGLALAYLGRGEAAIREGRRGLELWPFSRNAEFGAYLLHQLVRIYILAGEQEKAIDNLERLLQVPYVVSPAWLTIDPNFDPLRKNPRFQKLVANVKR